MSALLCVLLLFGTFPSLHAEKHSLYYIYTGLSKPVDLPGIYEFTAMGLLDDRQIDSYNSRDQRKIPTQTWMKEKLQEDYWEKGTQSRKSKEQWFHLSLNNLMDRMRHNQSDLHVLQWRVGCETEQYSEKMTSSKGIYEFSYDGENFISFDDEDSQWVAPVDEALPTKRKWDNEPKLNQNTWKYLKMECVDWLNLFRVYSDDEFRNASPPQVHVLVKISITDDTKLKLTCLATGFFPKDVMFVIRKHHTTLPEDVIESTGVRPNHDGTFQMRKSVEIKAKEEAEYDCYVAHSSLRKPIIAKWDMNRPAPAVLTIRVVMGGVSGGLIVVVFMLLIMALMYFILKRTSAAGRQRDGHFEMVNASEHSETSSLQDMEESDVMTGTHEHNSSADSGRGSACSGSLLEDFDQLIRRRSSGANSQNGSAVLGLQTAKAQS